MRDYRWLVGAFIADQLGSWAYNVVLVAFVFDRTHSANYLTLTGVARFVPSLLLSPYAGVLADRLERTGLVLISNLLAFAAMTGLALVIATGGPVLLALGFASLTAAVSTVNRPAIAALTPEVVGERDLAAANALQATLENLMVVLGPAVGGLFLLAGSKAAGVEANALSFLASAILISQVRARSRGEDAGTEESTSTALKAGFRTLAGAPVALTLVLFCCLDTAVFGASTVLFVPVSERLGSGSNGYAYLLAATALGGVVVAGAVDRLSAAGRLAPIILGGMLLLALPYAALTLTHSPAVAFALMVVSGAGMVAVDVLAVTAMQRDLPKASLGRVFGIFEALIPGSALLGSVVTAPLLNGFGLASTLVIVGLGISAISLISLPPVLRADRRTAAVAAELRPRVALLEVLDLLASASRPALERLAAAVEVVEIPADTDIVREGEAADALWVLVTGEVAVSARGEGGRSRRLRTLGPRSYFGEIGLLRGLPRTATVRTLEPSQLWRIPGEDFLAGVESASASTSMQNGMTSRLARSHPRLVEQPTTAPAS